MLIHNFLKNRKRNPGQSMVEFALVLPILVLFFIGTIEIGLIINDYIALNRAVSDAARYGSTLVGYSSAEVLVLGKLLDGLGENIKKQNLRVIAKSGTKYGPYTKSTTGTITAGGTAITTLSENLFFRNDNNTPNTFTDDLAASPLDFRCSYVEVSVEYDHDVVLPYANLISTAQFRITSSNTWPVTTVYPNLMPGQFQLTGALPIGVSEKMCVPASQSVVIKGDWLLPGGFGWLDLKVEYGAGNPNGNPNDLAAWITTPSSAPNKISPPENIYSMTGQKNASGVRDALAPLLGQKILVPMYDYNGSQGNNGFYHIVGFAVFTLDSVQDYPDLKASYVNTIYRVSQ